MKKTLEAAQRNAPYITLLLTEAEAGALYMHLATNCPSKELGTIHRRLQFQLQNRKERKE